MRSIVKLLSIATVFVAFPVFVIAQSPTPEPAKTAPKSTGKVTVKYDKGKDLTLISLKSMTITRADQEKQLARSFPQHQMEFEANFSYKGQFPGPPVEEVVLRFHCISSTYIFLRGQPLIVAVDRDIPGQDRAFSLGNTDYKSTAPKFNTVYEEFMEIKVPVDALKKFADAKTLEFFYGPIVYKFTAKQQDAFKEFRSFLPADAPAT